MSSMSQKEELPIQAFKVEAAMRPKGAMGPYIVCEVANVHGTVLNAW